MKRYQFVWWGWSEWWSFRENDAPWPFNIITILLPLTLGPWPDDDGYFEPVISTEPGAINMLKAIRGSVYSHRWIFGPLEIRRWAE